MGAAGPPPGARCTTEQAEGTEEEWSMCAGPLITAGKVSAELSHLRTDHHKLSDRVKDAEEVLEDLQPAHQALKSQIVKRTEWIKKLEHRAEDAEGRSRRNNMRIVGLQVNTEGPDAVTYLELWVRSIMKDRSLMLFFSLEREHCVPARPPASGRPPRPIVAKLIHLQRP
ncbi:hypothetical protein NDU88_002154 [Pleurodeles waltl]|uniref:Uncharacterized protein n=1 Tax=Pleurodeles waltl TaxID=8319 RepID=A0AAV7U9Z2_PLEWA|nr:hypothetical protein NDU88_002154 [Pleurodeles waltl]